MPTINMFRQPQLLVATSLFICFFAQACAFYDSSVETPAGRTTTELINLKDKGATGLGNVDESEILQKAIDSIGDDQIGKIYIPEGMYQFKRINLRSNVHISVAKGATIKVIKKSGTGFGALFQLGRQNTAIENVSIRGKDGQFKIDLTAFGVSERVRAFTLGKVTNFYIGNFHAEDRQSNGSVVLMSPEGKDKDDTDYPRKGTMENASVKNARYGYGLVQTHALKEVKFKNLRAVGGVALRVETGAIENNNDEIGGVFDLEASDITGENCKAGVLLSPHNTENGIVKVKNVMTTSCGFGVLVEAGFVPKNRKGLRTDLKLGTFKTGSYVKKVTAWYGTMAQLKPKDIKALPPKEAGEVKTDVSEDGESFRGSAIAAVGLKEPNFEVTISDVEAKGAWPFSPNEKMNIEKEDRST